MDKPIYLLPISIERMEDSMRKVFAELLCEDHSSKSTSSDADYLTRKETAQILRVTLPTLYDWTKRGYLQSYRMGSRIRYKRSEVNEAFDSGQLQKYGRAV